MSVIHQVPISRQRGLTLIELMISIALGLIIVSSLVFLIGTTMSNNMQQLRTTRLNQELRSLMQLIVRDVRRAGGISYAAEAIGFSTNHNLTLTATSGSGIQVVASSNSEFDDWVAAGVMIKAAQYDIGTGAVTNSCLEITGRISDTELQGNNVSCPGEADPNPFPSTELSANRWIFLNAFSTATRIQTDAAPSNIVSDAVNTTYNCIIVGYDVNSNGAADSNENFGFRWDENFSTLQSWQSGSVDCSDGDWQVISDEEHINITEFTITKLTEADAALIELRISLAGSMKANPNVSRSIVEVVKLRNDPVL